MPLNTNAKSQSGGIGFHVVLHKVFRDARQNMHLAQKAEGMAEYMLEERVKLRNKKNTTFTNLSRAAKEGELSPSLFKDLNDAETGPHEQDALLKEAEAKFEAAKEKYKSRLASFQQDKTNCEEAGCPWSHAARNEIHVISKEEEMAQKAARDEQERKWHQDAQARATEKERKDAAEKEKKKRWEEKWQRGREEYEKSQATKKRRREEYERENPRSGWQDGSKPFDEQQDEWPSGRSYQDRPSSEPRSKRSRPDVPQRSPAVSAVATPSRYQVWISTVEEAFKDYTTLSSFPSPPASACSKPTCKSETRALAACACDIRQGLGHLTASQLKDTRVLFHPDKFSKCREDLVEGFKKKANAVFVVVNSMYGEMKRSKG